MDTSASYSAFQCRVPSKKKRKRNDERISLAADSKAIASSNKMIFYIFRLLSLIFYDNYTPFCHQSSREKCGILQNNLGKIKINTYLCFNSVKHVYVHLKIPNNKNYADMERVDKLCCLQCLKTELYYQKSQALTGRRIVYPSGPDFFVTLRTRRPDPA